MCKLCQEEYLTDVPVYHRTNKKKKKFHSTTIMIT